MLYNNGPLQQSWFGKAGQGFSGWVWGFTQGISDYFSLKEKNDSLAAENARLTMLLAHKTDSLTRDSLAMMVPADRTVGSFVYTPTSIRKISNNTQHNYMILDKGLSDGVRVGNGVITARGAVGIVNSVSDNYSYALSFKNHQMSVSARLRKDGPVGTMNWDGVSRNKALLNEIPHHIILSPGDTVYTSGYSSIFPADIPLGTTGESKIVNGATYEIEITLFEDLSSLRYAIIVDNIDSHEIETLEKQ